MINIEYGSFGSVTVITSQAEFYSNDISEIISKGSELLDSVIELVSNGTSRNTEEAIKALEVARYLLEATK